VEDLILEVEEALAVDEDGLDIGDEGAWGHVSDDDECDYPRNHSRWRKQGRGSRGPGRKPRKETAKKEPKPMTCSCGRDCVSAVPPSVEKRIRKLFANSNKAFQDLCLYLMHSRLAANSWLLPGTLFEDGSERQICVGMVSSLTGTGKDRWRSALMTMARRRVKPNPVRTVLLSDSAKSCFRVLVLLCAVISLLCSPKGRRMRRIDTQSLWTTWNQKHVFLENQFRGIRIPK
jgi:hypothetical protein